MGEVIYNGRSSKDYGIEVETFPSYQTPKRSYEKVHVPGRNGDLIIDSGCWENVARSYLIAIGSYEIPYHILGNLVSEWLHTTTTYARLEDSYEPEYFRLAVYLNETSMTNIYNKGSEVNIDFDCKPQRFLKTGEVPIILESGGPSIIQNPTIFSSLPELHVYGTDEGSITVGDNTIELSSFGGEIIIDCDIQDAYLGDVNKNSMITLKNGVFPSLGSGGTSVSFDGGITRVEVKPRWFTL